MSSFIVVLAILSFSFQRDVFGLARQVDQALLSETWFLKGLGSRDKNGNTGYR